MRIHLSLVLFLALGAHPGLAQKKPLLSRHEEVTTRATVELDSLFKTGGPLQVEPAKRGLSGEYVMDITIFDKGKIQSIFVVTSTSSTAEMQNRVKDFIRSLEFGFKVPKSTNYKVRYTFRF